MMKLLAVSLVMQVLYTAPVMGNGDVYCKKVDVPDFYWRDFNGVVPFDAIEGGRDKLGRPVYVGQAAVYNVGNIPATIYHGKSAAVASSKETIYAEKSVKVLCSASPQKFKWIPTDIDHMSLITHCLIVPGGLDFEDLVYIGRAQFEGEVKIGKVIKKWNGILVPDNNGKETIIKNYELLVYDCKEKVAEEVTQTLKPY